MTYRCMEPDELALWEQAARNPRSIASSPCLDCPMAFHLAAVAEGRCDLHPQPRGGRPFVYATHEDRLAARRQSYRDSKRRARAA